jgi:hypothetical protein
MQNLISIHGFPQAVIIRFQELLMGDWESGLFRPIAWIYPPLMYSLPIGLAHEVRLTMLLLAFIGPLLYFRRSGASSARLWLTFLLLLAGAAALYEGLLLLSLQELGGMALVGLGLAIRKPWMRSGAFLLAALFKGPFSWVLIADGLLLWRQGNRRHATASLLAGGGVLLINVLWSRQGLNTGGYKTDPLDPELWRSASHILEVPTILLAVSMLWFLIATQLAPRRRDYFIFFTVAAVGYYVQMVPWSITAYYLGPIAFFFALLLASVLPDVGTPRSFSFAVAVSVPLLVALFVTWNSISFILRTNEVVREAVTCLKGEPNSKTAIFGHWLYVTTSIEGPIRIEQNVALLDPKWSGHVLERTNNPIDLLNGSTTHALVIGANGLPKERPGVAVCSGSSLTLWKLSGR